ncbi:DUF6088 family protein [Aeromonas jandaei]|uniref:DUF6088 family protein n=1 Tax=Aeromonas jandaei TaxID=650 RepID=UPI003F7AEAE0
MNIGGNYMSITKKVNSYVIHQRYGYVFTLNDVVKNTNLEEHRKSVVSALRRCVASGIVMRLSPGLYFRPRKGRFGSLPVDTRDLIKALSKNKKADFVVSGATAVNHLGVSTQLPMVRSYVMTERVRVHLKTINVKIEYSKSLSYFSCHLKISSKAQRENALLFWSALQYINRERFSDYRKELIDVFNETLDHKAKENFLKALPPSMAWARKELADYYE